MPSKPFPAPDETPMPAGIEDPFAQLTYRFEQLEEGSIRVEAIDRGVVVATIDALADGRTYDVVEMPDDEQLIRHFSLEEAGDSVASERAFEEQRMAFEYALSEHLAALGYVELARVKALNAPPLPSLHATPAVKLPAPPKETIRGLQRPAGN